MTDVLKAAIEESGLSRYRIAKDTGLTEPSLCRFVQGRTSLRLDKATCWPNTWGWNSPTQGEVND